MPNDTLKFYETKLIGEGQALILGFDFEYVVTNKGEIISYARYHNKNMVMKQHKGKDGYMNIGLIKNGKSTAHRVHRIVACAFIPNPDNKPYINHKDGTRDNNCVDNLEWCTQKENVEHSIHTLGRWSNSEKQCQLAKELGIRNRKLSMEDAREIRRIYASGEMGCYKLAKKFNLSKPCILRILHNRSYIE